MADKKGRSTESMNREMYPGKVFSIALRVRYGMGGAQRYACHLYLSSTGIIWWDSTMPGFLHMASGDLSPHILPSAPDHSFETPNLPFTETLNANTMSNCEKCPQLTCSPQVYGGT